jgi:hypothetical protein
MAQLITRDDRSGVLVTDWRDLVKTMKSIDPTLVKQMRKDFRAVGRPTARAVSRAIPNNPPTSGVHKRGSKNVSGFAPIIVPGRLTWTANSQNGSKKPNHTIVKLPRLRTKFKNGATVSSIVRIDVDNAAVVMADMAGRSGKWVNKRSITRPYHYSRGNIHQVNSKGGVDRMRQHRINGQGRGMIRALDKIHKPSRWIWPAADAQLPTTRYEAIKVLSKAYNQINQQLRTK